MYEHVVLATQTYSPMDFAAQITLSQGNMWGIMRLFIKIFEDQPEGKVSALPSDPRLFFRSPSLRSSPQYVIMRDPNRAIVRVYGVPAGTFEDSDGSDDDGDGSGSDNDGGDDARGDGDEE